MKLFKKCVQLNFNINKLASSYVTKIYRAQPNSSEIKIASNLCEKASLGDINSLKQLIKEGCNINSTDYDFRTALHLASAIGNKDVVKLLLDNGAKITVDRFGGLPIHDALRNNH